MLIKTRVKIILPIAVIIVCSLILNNYFDAEGLYINLATEMIGILITILYIDHVLSYNEMKKWKPVDKKIYEELRIYINNIITIFRISLNMKIDIFDYKEFGNISELNALELNKVMIKYLVNNIVPNVDVKIKDFNSKEWERLITELKEIQDKNNKIRSMYISRLNPDLLLCLIETHDLIQSITNIYATFPDIIANDEKSIHLNNTLEIEEIRNSIVLTIINKISKLLNDIQALEKQIPSLE